MSLGYLLASLPMLSPDRAPAVSVENFCLACASALSAADATAAALLATGGLGASSHPYVRQWRDLESAMEIAIGKKRLARRGGASTEVAAPETTVCPVWLTRLIDAAFETAADPLMREEMLLKARWAAADEMGGFDPMAKSQLFAYAVKLRLATRRAILDRAKGLERLDAALPQQTL